MKRYAIFAVAVLTGCSGPLPVPTEKPQVAQRDLASTPSVEFVGDEISAGLLASSNNPMWRCDDCIDQADSTVALENFSAALATNPNIIVITVGSYDIRSDTFAGLYDEDCTLGGAICSNLEAMVTKAQQAGAKVIVGTIPPFGPGAAALVFQDCCDVGYEIERNQADWNSQIATLFPKGGPVTVVDFASILQESVLTGDPAWTFLIDQFTPGYTTDGVHPDAAGYTQMLALVTPAIYSFRVGSGPK